MLEDDPMDARNNSVSGLQDLGRCTYSYREKKKCKYKKKREFTKSICIFIAIKMLIGLEV